MVTSADKKEEPEFREDQAKQLIAKLNDCAKEMEYTLLEWENEVNKSRSRYYELNYYTTRQMLRLRKELGLMISSKDRNYMRHLDPEVLVLLQSISYAVTEESVHTLVAQCKTPKQTVDKVVESDEVDEREPLKGNSTLFSELTFSDTVENGTAESPVTVTNATLEASEDMKMHLTLEELSDDQKKILDDLVEYQGYPELLVLKAFKKCNEKANSYDIHTWCAENEDLYAEEQESQQGDESDHYTEETDSDEETQSSLFKHSPLGMPCL